MSTFPAKREDRDTKEPVHIQQRKSDIQRLLSMPAGRRFIRRLLSEFARIEETSFMPKDASTTAFNEGRRKVGIEVKQDLLRADPHAIRNLVAKEEEDNDVQ